MKRNPTFAVLVVGLAAIAVPPAWADYDLFWHTFDGGGAMFSTGGNFSLGGTIGQPDASNTLSGGNFGLVGGFWAVGAAGEAPCSGSIRGDSDCSGSVDFDDIDCFVSSLIDEASWDACGHGAGCDYTCVNDINQDNSVDFDDIDGFVECLIGGGCP